MKSRIHVNQHHIRANAKDGGTRDVLSIKTYKGTRTAKQLEIVCPCGCDEVAAVVTYSPDKPLACGARVWIEADGEIIEVL